MSRALAQLDAILSGITGGGKAKAATGKDKAAASKGLGAEGKGARGLLDIVRIPGRLPPPERLGELRLGELHGYE